jgi:four helix bundle protein
MPSTFKDLRVWQYAMRLATDAYRATACFPKHEVYGLTQQMRRAAVSIASNIAEGKGRRTDCEFLRFLFITRGSLLEFETQAMIAKQLEYMHTKQSEDLLEAAGNVGKALTGLINSLQDRETSTPTTDDQRPTTNV